MDRLPVLATGLSGLVGTRVKELLSDSFDFTDLSLATGIDITDQNQVTRAFDDSDAKIVLHMAAKTDVDSCEDDKILGKEGGAWQVNVVGTENIAEAALKTGKRIVYISTDFVFDGMKDSYKESDLPNPVSWYGYTKFLGEERLYNKDKNVTIVRISYPYRKSYHEKKDFVHKMKDVMINNHKILGLTDHIFTPTFVDDIANALKILLSRDLPGIFHVVGSENLTTFSAAEMIADCFKIKAEITPATRAQYFKDRAFRPFKLALNNDKIQQLGITMKGFKEGLQAVKKQDG